MFISSAPDDNLSAMPDSLYFEVKMSHGFVVGEIDCLISKEKNGEKVFDCIGRGLIRKINDSDDVT